LRRSQFLLVMSAALLLMLGCAAQAWRVGAVAGVLPGGLMLMQSFDPRTFAAPTQDRPSSSTQFRCGKKRFQHADSQPYEPVTGAGGHRGDGSTEATAVTLRPTRSQCESDAPSSTSEDKEVRPSAAWELKYRSGSLQLRKDQWLKARFLATDAEDNPIHAALLISRDQLNAIYFYAKAQRDSDVVQRMPRSGCYQAHYLMPKDESAPGPEMFAVWAESPGRIARVAERLNARYRVRLTWNSNGVEKELEFSVQYCEYASFLANLRWFAADRWKDLAREFSR
jgi:hypothetical protein